MLFKLIIEFSLVFLLCPVYFQLMCIHAFSVWFNKTKVHNANILFNAIENRKESVPLLTISNHHSCFDDPGLWG